MPVITTIRQNKAEQRRPVITAYDTPQSQKSLPRAGPGLKFVGGDPRHCDALKSIVVRGPGGRLLFLGRHPFKRLVIL